LNNTPSLYVGVMSGTSIDGADAILADFAAPIPRVIGFHSEQFPPALRAELLALNVAGENEIERSHLAANALAVVYARAVAALLAAIGSSSEDVEAIGCHGQTVRHRPDLGFTVQLNNPALLAEMTSIAVVADFRSRDIAAGGQGAPLVPAFHDGVFRAPGETRVVINIGGIANITVLEKNKPAWGFDCGPGNCLMDAWIDKTLGNRFDESGAWAGQGLALARLSSQFQSERYFQQAPPKSTGRDLFNLQWLEQQLTGNEAPIDVQATLLDLTATSIADAVKRYAPECARVLVCGGGAQNSALMARISQLLPHPKVDKTDAFGVPAQQVEALAFAWLAKQAIERRAIDMRATTGAKRAAILGAIYPK
jgi:anhydro-N-acetylmuramic acid kinase